jgi:hypothetical protein
MRLSDRHDRPDRRSAVEGTQPRRSGLIAVNGTVVTTVLAPELLKLRATS